MREFVLKPPHGRADYLLFVDGRAAGVIEAKKEGETLTGVEWQSAKYVDGLPDEVPSRRSRAALPFVYESTGTETRFTNTARPGRRRAGRCSRSTGPRRSPAGSTDIRAHPTAPTLRHRLRALPDARADGPLAGAGHARSRTSRRRSRRTARAR